MKILVIGCAGAGKTTLAKNLSIRTGLPYFSLDEFYWKPNWKKNYKNEFKKKIREILYSKSWIMDGMYPELLSEISQSNIKDIIIIYLKIKKITSLFRIVKRTFFRVVTKEEVCNGNVESFKNLIGDSGIIPYAFKSYDKTKKKCNLLIGYSYKSFTVSNNKELKELVNKLSTSEEIESNKKI
ncbi:hypothetical protein [Enterococcus sp. DIV0212c]|uniref:hypothetical protein n=1 Tax=Enterococcus sp. DIV0212c TaxID=2230867 RepID=UPI001A9BB8AA|nr:hypothetical protein [Enterococcus sp. DIV0212c]MBO1354668.1 hypothetical protein [Enterococcus sp. DIV0212c]